uniref:OTU domain-containing protein 3 n=1 Tax=Monopterus albus TaxID=43700 RepID=A0A3Q3IZR1_MONAL|nr:OTU domain-containing protein 3 [Monopterus albus]XP_020468289.1 OTU domain-containing protein 3 [Monopterus albus]XP_020468290.1 OTU domain-containing protein 3 [Monopterus albus]XP_020468291.1 OTU domain-containing protein 3 [Monopterus albus]XP_020468292.1 OTU domain-containing protein 3 [Monopterus albus]
MSRKQTSKPVRSNKKSELERKKDERAARRAIVKDRKNRPQDADEGEEFVSFSNQLQALGLKLREVPGDGNCLFRALADQLEGHSRGHLRLRQETVQYMMSHRQDFEPFVEDDVPFAQHLSNLSQPGTFAGNDAIVAFARSQQVKVVIHQLNTPLWEINGAEKQVCRELHIAYRYGDHYDSVRRTGDNSESPAQLRIENLQNSRGQQREFGDGQRDRQKNTSSTASEEDSVILSSIKNRGIQGDEENLLQLSAATINAEWLVGSVLGQSCHGQSASGPCSACRAPASDCCEQKQSAESSNVQKPKVSNKQRKEQQRYEKKKRQEERHRQKVLQSKGSQDQNQNLPEAVTLVPALNTLSI